MKYVLVGSLGNINKSLVRILTSAKQEVTVITHHPSRVSEIEKTGARTAVGSVEDTDFLSRSFLDADVVYTMVPPKYDAPDMKKHIHQIGRNLAAAIKGSGVQKVVNLSSVGAHMSSGSGPVVGLHRVELELNALNDVDVKHLRPGYFYFNFFPITGMIRQAGFYGNNFGPTADVFMVHPDSIAEAAAQEILNPTFTGKSFRYVADDMRNSLQITNVLGNAIRKPDLKYVEFSDEQAQQGMIAAGMPPNVAENYAEMGRSIRTGEMMADLKKANIPLGRIKLEDFAPVFAETYAQEGGLHEA